MRWIRWTTKFRGLIAGAVACAFHSPAHLSQNSFTHGPLISIMPTNEELVTWTMAIGAAGVAFFTFVQRLIASRSKAKPKIKMGYWGIRGLGAPLRMMLEYAGADYEDTMYSDPKKWFGEKYAMRTRTLDGRSGCLLIPVVCAAESPNS